MTVPKAGWSLRSLGLRSRSPSRGCRQQTTQTGNSCPARVGPGRVSRKLEASRRCMRWAVSASGDSRPTFVRLILVAGAGTSLARWLAQLAERNRGLRCVAGLRAPPKKVSWEVVWVGARSHSHPGVPPPAFARARPSGLRPPPVAARRRVKIPDHL